MSSSRAPALVSVVVVAATAGLLLVAKHGFGPTVSFVPALLSVVACFDLLSVYLLMGDYRDNGDRRILAMCGAYVWSLVLMAGYALAFPGVVAAHPPLALTPSVAPWLHGSTSDGTPAFLSCSVRLGRLGRRGRLT